MRGKSGASHFASVPQATIPRSSFDLSHGHKTTFDADWLVPFHVEEILPGDTFNVRAAVMARLSTSVVPLMDNLYLDFFWFFIPYRLVWDNWQKFCGEQLNPGDSTDVLMPQAEIDPASFPTPPGMASTSGIFYEYLGVPYLNLTPGQKVKVNNLFARAYNLVWTEFFRDQNLQQRATVDMGDGPDNPDNYYLRRRAKRPDYFTTCLPWPQKDAGVNIPVGGILPVTPVTPAAIPLWGNASGTSYGGFNVAAAGANAAVRLDAPTAAGGLYWKDPKLQVNLAASGTINSLRQAFQIQRMLERDARSGTRYTEILRGHWGVTSPDFRLQRPEYLGGGSVPIHINPVVQTSGTAQDEATGYSATPQGNLAGYGVAAASKNGFVKSFTEHGCVIGLVCGRADVTYQQGLDRKFTRRTKFDHYWPALAHLGEQAVLNREIYLQGDGVAADAEVFGYQERWAEYRYGKSRITGQQNSKHPTPLDYWHLAEEFSTLPTLSATFIESNPPVSRSMATQQGVAPHFVADFWISIRAARPMPVYSIPGMADHF